MTTAKPQPLSDQVDAADDLIAELAKLMAQDTQSDRTQGERIQGDREEPARAPSGQTIPFPSEAQKPFSFRLPADDVATGAREAPADVGIVPFSFDFDPPAHQPHPEPARIFAAAPGRAAPVDEPLPPVHDVIGDLIAAELAAESMLAPPAPIVEDFPAEAVDEENLSEIAAAYEPEPVPPARSPDSFRVAPVLGVDAPRSGPRVAAVAPLPREAAADPIVDIESLIGDAVRVQLGAEPPVATAAPAVAPEPPPPPAAPALRSLATPVLPQREVEPRFESEPARQRRSAESVEDAILEAAEATGSEVDWIEGGEEAGEDALSDEYYEDEPPRRRGLARALIGPAIAFGLLGVAGVGLYALLGSGGADGPAPLLLANADPVKDVVPVPETGQGSQSVVFSEMSGLGTPTADEQLLSRDQSGDGGETVTAALPPDLSEEGLVNRKVRTVTVRPDGTIVSGEDTLAGAAMLPVDRPVVPELPQLADAFTGAAVEAAESVESLIAALDPSATAIPATTATPTPTPPPPPPLSLTPTAASSATPLPPGGMVTAVDAAGNVLAGRSAPVPMARIERPSAPTPQLAAASAPLNAVIPATAPAASAAAPASTAPAYVQLSSQRTEEAARQTLADLQTRFGGLFGGVPLEVQRVDLGERGIYYRVRLPAQSAQSATQICNSVKAGGGDCFTL